MKITTLLIAYIIEMLHRYCFDKYYVQNYNIRFVDSIVLRVYKILVWSFKDFRQHLKLTKKIFNRAYLQHRLSFKYVCIYFLLNKRNYIRYN
jgi:hypothetical protein